MQWKIPLHLISYTVQIRMFPTTNDKSHSKRDRQIEKARTKVSLEGHTQTQYTQLRNYVKLT